MRLMQFQIDDIIKTALLEDINYIDVTTDYLVDEIQFLQQSMFQRTKAFFVELMLQ